MEFLIYSQHHAFDLNMKFVAVEFKNKNELNEEHDY